MLLILASVSKKEIRKTTTLISSLELSFDP